MRKLIYLLAALAVAGGTCLKAEQNLLPNADFEQAGKKGMPKGGWWLYQGHGSPQVAMDTTLPHQGKVAMRLEAPASAKFCLVSPKFTVSAGDQIRFSAWVRPELVQTNEKALYAGIAYRKADGQVFGRQHLYFGSKAGQWSLLTTNVVVPPEAAQAEAHFGYVNGHGKVWVDDASAAILNPISMSLLSEPKAWVGRQELRFQFTSRAPSDFQGKLRILLHKKPTEIPVQVKAQRHCVIKAPIELAGVGNHAYNITLFDSQNSPVTSLEGKFQTTTPLQVFPACPVYHVVGQGSGETRLDAAVAVEPAKRAGLRFKAIVTDSTGKEVAVAETDASKAEMVKLKFRIPVKTTNDFLITAQLLDRTGQELGRTSTDLHVGTPESCRVTLAPDGYFRVDGKPFFSVGMYSCGQLEEMGPAGFNGTHTYQVVIGNPDLAINPHEAGVKRFLDNSWKNGMRAMIELPRPAIEKAQWQQVRRRIETFRNHPGLLCWGSEERVARGIAPLKNLEKLYKIVKEMDPNHPLVLGDTWDVVNHLQKDRRNFFPDQCMDVGIWWWYPIPLRAGGSTDGDALQGREDGLKLLQPPSWLTTTLSKKPLWIAIQSYQQPWKGARFPTPEEYRAMAYLSIINGVKGLWFYTGYGQKDYDGKPSGLLNKTEEGHWDYVKKLVGELRDFSPVITAVTPAAKVQMTPANAPVEFALREYQGKIYLLAANKAETEQTVRFSGSCLKGKQVQVLHERHNPSLQGEQLSDRFAPFAVHVYRLD